MANGDFQQIANILGAASAGLGGGGAGAQQFLQNQQREVDRQADRQRVIRAEEEGRQKELDLQRRQTVFTDSFTALNFAEQGDFASVVLLGQNRLRDSANFPQADFSDTENLTKLAELAANGDQEAGKRLTNQLRTNVELGEALGILKAPEAFTLSPGQERFRGREQIAAVPEDEGKAEARSLRKQEAELKRQEIKLRTETNQLKRDELRAGIERAEADRQFQAESSLANFDDSLATIDQLLEGTGLESAAGVGSIFPTLPGTEAANFEATLEVLQSQNFLNAVEKMKGLGALSENEGRKLSAAIGALDLSQSDKRLRSEIGKIRTKITEARGRAEKKFNISAPSLTTPPPPGVTGAPGAPAAPGVPGIVE